MVWLGRFSPDKAAHLAIDVARQAGRRSVLVGKCTEPDEQGVMTAVFGDGLHGAVPPSGGTNVRAV